MKVKLGDVCDKGTSGIAQKDLENCTGDYPIYGAAGFISNVDFYQQEKPYIAVVKDGAGIGRIMKLPAKSSVISTMQYIFPNEKVDISYLAYAMEYMNLAKYYTGATIPHIYFKDYKKEEINLIDLNWQQHIAAVLDKVSDLIALRKKQLAKLDELVKARFVEMFLLEQNNQNKQTIGECCKLKSGTTLSLELENEGGDIPYIKVGDMNIKENLNYITTSSRFVSKATAGSGVFPTGSIIFPKRGGAIATNKKRLTSLPICADLNIMGVIPGNNLLPIYLFVYFLLIDLGTLDNGSSVPQINNKDIAPLYICIPSLKLQQVFVNFVEVVDKQKTTIKQSLEKLETLKKSLMQEYFG